MEDTVAGPPTDFRSPRSDRAAQTRRGRVAGAPHDRTVTDTVRWRGRSSKSSSTTCCHVPRPRRAVDDRDRLRRPDQRPRAGARARWCRRCGRCGRSRRRPAAPAAAGARSSPAGPRRPPRSNSIVVTASVEPTPNTTATPSCTWEARTTERTPSVRSTISPSPRVETRSRPPCAATQPATRTRAKRRLPARRTRAVDALAAAGRARPTTASSTRTPPGRDQAARLRARHPERVAQRLRAVDRVAVGGRHASPWASRRARPRCTKTRSNAASAACAASRAVVALDDRPRQRALGVARAAASGSGSRPSSSRYHVPIASSGSDSVLPYCSSGGSVSADVVAQRLGHLLVPVGADQQRQRQHRLLGLPVGALDVAAQQQVELLVGAAQLDVGARSPPSRSPAAADTAARAPRSARAPTSAWRSRRARAPAPPSPRARGGTGPRSACPATRS